MDFKHFTAGKDDDGRRLDRIARKLMNENALSSLYKSIRKGLIKVNGKKAKEDTRIIEGDDISIADFLITQTDSNSKDSISIPEEMIIFRNEHIIFLNKPYDISVQQSNDSKISLNEIVEADSKSKRSESISFKTGPLHRLDRKTTGVIAFSQDLKGAQIFSEMMQKHNFKKIYTGIVQGHLKEKQIWEDKIEKIEKNEKQNSFHTVKIVDTNNANGKDSYTEAKPLKYGNYKGIKITLVQFTIKTGRMHQIRVQSASKGFPLLGDTAYGSKKIEETQDFFLHATKLEFDFSKMENELEIPQTIEAKFPENFNKMITKYFIKT